jgi:hypothetical protein
MHQTCKRKLTTSTPTACVIIIKTNWNRKESTYELVDGMAKEGRGGPTLAAAATFSKSFDMAMKSRKPEVLE